MVTDVVKILQAVFIVAVTYVQVGVNSSFGDITSVSFVLLPCNVADTLMGWSCDETAGTARSHREGRILDNLRQSAPSL